ncbi:MAG: hypothetical protein ABL925_04035 [Methylococcales bacterium]
MTDETDIDALVAQMSEGISAIMREEAEYNVLFRFNQPKTVAYLDAEFRVHDDIPEEFKQGIFAEPGTYPAKLRFANATQWDDSKRDVRGLSMRLANVSGDVLWGEPGYQDFLLNSYPALFVATPEDFLAFIQARQFHRKLGFFLNPFAPHLKSLWIVLKSHKHVLSHLDVRYWSTVPFRLGADSSLAVKYSLIPGSDYQTTVPEQPGPNQSRAAIKAHLQREPACFHFALQKQTDPVAMPIEDASVIWDEASSPFISVATLTIAKQTVDSPEQLLMGERSSFNPWQCLADHAPLGRMNAVRRLVYANAAALRNQEQTL